MRQKKVLPNLGLIRRNLFIIQHLMNLYKNRLKINNRINKKIIWLMMMEKIINLNNLRRQKKKDNKMNLIIILILYLLKLYINLFKFVGWLCFLVVIIILWWVYSWGLVLVNFKKNISARPSWIKLQVNLLDSY